MAQCYVIADDLTGACDTGAGFAQRGLATVVTLHVPDAAPAQAQLDADVLVYSTESRYLPVGQAVQTVETVARRISVNSPSALPPPPALSERTSPTERGCFPPLPRIAGGGVRAWVYKKIDSTLRGHPGAELAALMRAWQMERALVAPAFPAHGRVVVDGQVWVNGVALAQTPFAREVPTSDVMALFAPHFGGSNLQHIGLNELRRGAGHCGALLQARPGVWVADAETDGDLATLAQVAVLSGIRLLCGSAGLATALAAIVSPAAGTSRTGDERREGGGVLVVAGSRHPATIRQIEAAQRSGWVVLQPAPAVVLSAQDDLGAVVSIAREAAACLARGHSVVVTTAGLPDSAVDRRVIAARLGAVVAHALTLTDVLPVGLVLTGGDVAAAVCVALGATALRLRGQAQPGIALGQLADGCYAGLSVATKAGGFGSEDTLLTTVSAMRIPLLH